MFHILRCPRHGLTLEVRPGKVARMNPFRGVVLITALLFLSFLSILGGALLMTSTIDVWISDNYGTSVQTLYLAEAGIAEAREILKTLPMTLGDALNTAAGLDGVISSSRDLAALLAGDDQPLVPVSASLRMAGQPLTDATGRAAGTYHVWLRNDVADGMTSIADFNNVVQLLAFASVGTGRKAIEVTVRRGGFPRTPAALTLIGDPVAFGAADSSLFRVDGNDEGSANQDENGIGVISGAAAASVDAAIADSYNGNYLGAGSLIPDIAGIGGEMDPRLTTVSGLESIASRIAAVATDSYAPAYDGSASLGNIGSSSNPRIVAVAGNCDFGGIGFGVLLVRGNLTLSGNFNWNGLVLAIGQGKIYWNSGGNGSIHGAMFVASTRNDDDRSAVNPIGTLRSAPGPVVADFTGAGGAGIQYNTTAIEEANRVFPFSVIAYRE